MWRADPWSSARVMVAAAMALLVAGCIPNPAPPGWLPTPLDAPSDAHGAWIELTPANDSMIAGEFLAYERDTVWILLQDSSVHAQPIAGLATSRIFRYDSQLGIASLTTVAGLSSTFSNGVFLGLTAPLWIVAGSASAAADSRAAIEDPARSGWEAARIHARYPTGKPANLPERLPPKKSSSR